MSGDDKIGELVRLLHQRYQDSGDTLARKAAWRIEELARGFTPTDEQLDALFYHYRILVQAEAPAPDLKTLHDRQRAAWDAMIAVFNKVPDA